MKLPAPVVDWGGGGGVYSYPLLKTLYATHVFLEGVDVTEDIAIGFKVLLLQELPIFLEWLDYVTFIVHGMASQRNGSKENSNFVLGAQQT